MLIRATRDSPLNNEDDCDEEIELEADKLVGSKPDKSPSLPKERKDKSTSAVSEDENETETLSSKEDKVFKSFELLSSATEKLALSLLVDDRLLSIGSEKLLDSVALSLSSSSKTEENRNCEGLSDTDSWSSDGSSIEKRNDESENLITDRLDSATAEVDEEVAETEESTPVAIELSTTADVLEIAEEDEKTLKSGRDNDMLSENNGGEDGVKEEDERKVDPSPKRLELSERGCPLSSADDRKRDNDASEALTEFWGSDEVAVERSE